MRYPLFAGFIIFMACTGRNPQPAEKPGGYAMVSWNSWMDTLFLNSTLNSTVNTTNSSICKCDHQAADTVVDDASAKRVVIDRFRLFPGKVVYGDFDGNGVTDTLSERLMKMNKRRFIKSVPDPEYNLWESVVDYCNRNYIASVLVTSGVAADTIYFSGGLGTFVILNVGDINKDGADDLALVWNLLDFSNLNICQVYSLCGSQWEVVKAFGINEHAFSWRTGDRKDSIAAHSQITDWLEKRKGVWKYRDYEKWAIAETEEEANKMHVLRGKRCDQ